MILVNAPSSWALQEVCRWIVFWKVFFTKIHFGFITGEMGKKFLDFFPQKAVEDVLIILSGLKTCEIFD